MPTYNNRFSIYFRQRQYVDGVTPQVVQCTGGVAEYVPGTVPKPDWEDMTAFTEGLEKITLTWNSSGGANSEGGNTTSSGSNYDKGISLDLRFSLDAFYYINDWLLSTQCSVLNTVEVLLKDNVCNNVYRVFEIKADNLTYRPIDDDCVFEVKLREQDLAWHCISKTFIWDNWQNWFNATGTKDHPCFLTGIEARPRLIQSVRFGLLTFMRSFPITGLIIGSENDNKARRILNLDNFCPSPLIRDIISNICDKCGLTYDHMFEDDVANPYRNLCLFYPCAGYYHKNDGSAATSPSLRYILDNRWNVTLDEFLDKLKKMFNAEWYITPNNELVFKPITFFLNLTPIYDFTAPGAVAMYELTYTFNGEKKPAYGRYQYTTDGTDLASMEIEPLYNDIVDYDGDVDNPMLEGERSKGFEFAPTGFIRDGRKEDYIGQVLDDGAIIARVLTVLMSIVVAALFAGVFSAGAAVALAAFVAAMMIIITAVKNGYAGDFEDFTTLYTGCVRVTAESLSQPRLLLWDGVAMNRAKVVNQGLPTPDTYYNPTSIAYNVGNTINTNNVVFNYPMYYDAMYQNNMYDRFMEATDNPMLNPESYQEFTMYVELCCEMLDILGVWQGQFVKIGYMVKLEQRPGYEVFGRITNIEVQYDENKIVLRGKVFKKPL